MCAVAVSIHTAMSWNKQPSTYVQSPRVLQTCVIVVSLLSITAKVIMFTLTHVQCMLTLAAVYSFFAQPHWTSACLILLHAAKATINLKLRLIHIIEYAIQSLARSPQDTERYILETNQEQDTTVT